MAQSVERFTRNEQVIGSIPITSSNKGSTCTQVLPLIFKEVSDIQTLLR